MGRFGIEITAKDTPIIAAVIISVMPNPPTIARLYKVNLPG